MTRSRVLRRLPILLASLPLTAGGATLASLPHPVADATIVHVLNRLAYGPRPGDVAKVRKLGLEHWIDLQLHPDRIPDGSLEKRLAPLATVSLSTPDLMREYDLPRQAKQEIARRKSQLYAPDLKGSPPIMELHTLGVDGGYTQKDVSEVARCLTGWTITGLRDERRDPEFAFVQALHDPGDKAVLGHPIRSGGRSEGDEVIHILATHPATARFIAAKLARRFVSDTPPPALIERAAATFQRTDGDIRSVVETIVKSPEFLEGTPGDAKIKSPLEFVASAARASGATIVDAREAVRRLSDMGMPLYLRQPPSGYKDTSAAWASTGGMLARLDLALDLAAGRLEGVELQTDKLAPRHASQAATVDSLAERLLPAGLSPSTRASLEAPKTADLDAERLAGLILGSPDFQGK